MKVQTPKFLDNSIREKQTISKLQISLTYPNLKDVENELPLGFFGGGSACQYYLWIR